MQTADNKAPWRAERNPAKGHEWLIVRIVHDEDGRPTREVARHAHESGAGQPLTFCSEDDAEGMCEQLNPHQGTTIARPLALNELYWLKRVGAAPEGTMQPDTNTVLLGLEARGLVYSRAEPDRVGFDRWTLTDAGRQHLEGKE